MDVRGGDRAGFTRPELPELLTQCSRGSPFSSEAVPSKERSSGMFLKTSGGGPSSSEPPSMALSPDSSPPSRAWNVIEPKSERGAPLRCSAMLCWKKQGPSSTGPRCSVCRYDGHDGAASSSTEKKANATRCRSAER